MNDNTRSKLGIICAICVFFIIIGSLAGWSLYNRFATKNEQYGEAKIYELDGDIQNFHISDDESVFFSYSTNALVFDDYKHCVNFEKTTLLDDKAYTIYLNGTRIVTTRQNGKLSSKPILKFNHVGEGNYMAPVGIEFIFYNDRSIMVINATDNRTAGYLNQLAKIGLNVRIVESPLMSDEDPIIKHGKDVSILGNKMLIDTNETPLNMWVKRTQNPSPWVEYTKTLIGETLVEYRDSGMTISGVVGESAFEEFVQLFEVDGIIRTQSIMIDNTVQIQFVQNGTLVQISLLSTLPQEDIELKIMSVASGNTILPEETAIIDTQRDGWNGKFLSDDSPVSVVLPYTISQNLLSANRVEIKYSVKGHVYSQTIENWNISPYFETYGTVVLNGREVVYKTGTMYNTGLVADNGVTGNMLWYFEFQGVFAKHMLKNIEFKLVSITAK